MRKKLILLVLKNSASHCGCFTSSDEHYFLRIKWPFVNYSLLGMGIFANFLFQISIGFKNKYSGGGACVRGGAWP